MAVCRESGVTSKNVKQSPANDRTTQPGQIRLRATPVLGRMRVRCNRGSARSFDEAASALADKLIRARSPTVSEESQSDLLKGWKQIAEFLGQPISVAQRWATTGMPVTRQGRFVVATPEELNNWLGRESGEPVHVVTNEADLSEELKRGLSHVRKEQRDSLAASQKSGRKRS